jgi:hypothetical protein
MIYKIGFRQPMAEPGDEDKRVQNIATGIAYMLVGQQGRSFDQLINVLFDADLWTDPFGNYYEQRRGGIGGRSIANTPVPTRGLARWKAAVLKLSGAELGLKPVLDSKRVLQQTLKLNAKLGLSDPLGEYTQNDIRIQQLQRNLSSRNLENIERYEAGDLTALESENIQEFRTNLREWGARRVAKVEMQNTNSVIRGYENDKKLASLEGQSGRKALDKLLKVEMPGIRIPEPEKSEDYKESVRNEKQYTKDLIRILKQQLRDEAALENSSFSDPD